MSVFDSHPDRPSAIDHLKQLARDFGQGTLIFVHALGGTTEQVE